MYIIVNLIILKNSQWYDVIYLIGLIFYAFIFWMRDLEKMLYLTTIPTTLSILYNVISGAAVFAVASYTFELGANLVGIYKYHIQNKNAKVIEKQQGEKHEKD